ncbi:MAG: DinB family protein [Gemmatimonadota bacterium]
MPRTADRRPLSSRAALVHLLDAAFHGPAWHGPSLKLALRGVRADRALWRPGAGRPNAWEHALHCAIGKQKVANRLEPTRRLRFPRQLTSAWWAAAPRLSDAAARERAWREDLALLDDSHQRLIETLARIKVARLQDRHARSRFVLGEHIAGLALHDSYHAGQVALVLRLADADLR